jgi:hypothetical protein
MLVALRRSNRFDQSNAVIEVECLIRSRLFIEIEPSDRIREIIWEIDCDSLICVESRLLNLRADGAADALPSILPSLRFHQCIVDSAHIKPFSDLALGAPGHPRTLEEFQIFDRITLVPGLNCEAWTRRHPSGGLPLISICRLPSM